MQKLEIGKRYKAGVRGHKSRSIVTIEDSEFGDLLAVSSDGKRQRVDELDESIVFEPVDDLEVVEMEAAGMREKLWDLEERANRWRQQGDELERQACELLGVAVGDGSPRSDAVCRFIRDGYGMLSVYADVGRELSPAG